MPTLACHCGKRFTVGPKAGRETVVCPTCGEAVRVNGAATEPAVLTFGVKVVDRRETEPAADTRTIAFSCPGCGKEFSESRRAAGKPTRCPKCATDFVIPAAGVGTAVSREPAAGEKSARDEELRSLTHPARQEGTEAGVEAAVAAYAAGKQHPGKKRTAGRSMVPIGFCLILLGGLVSILGSVLLAKGFQDSFSASALGGGIAGGAGGGLMGPMADYSKLLRELAGEPNAKRRGADPLQQPLNKLPVPDAAQAAKDYKQSLKEQEEKRSSGQTKILGGVIAGGLGMLITLIGSIYLLAGLIGRFIQPQASPAVEPTTTA